MSKLFVVICVAAFAIVLGAPMEAGGAGATTLELDRTSTPAGRVFVVRGSCPLPPSPPPFGHARISLSNGYMFRDVQVSHIDGSFVDQLEVPASTPPADYEVTLMCFDDSTDTAPLTVTEAEPFVQPTLQIDDSTPRPGQVVRLTGTCNTPGERVVLVVEAAEEDRTGFYTRELGETQADDQLRFDVQVRIPADLDPNFVPYNGQRGEWLVSSRCLDYEGATVTIFLDGGGTTEPAAAVPGEPDFTG